MGRALRDAQNDILAAVGVVERKRVHIAGFPLPPPKDPLVIKQVEAEDLSGTLVAIIGTLTRYAGTWWVSALHDRILVCHSPRACWFLNSDPVALDFRLSQRAFICGISQSPIHMGRTSSILLRGPACSAHFYDHERWRSGGFFGHLID